MEIAKLKRMRKNIDKVAKEFGELVEIMTKEREEKKSENSSEDKLESYAIQKIEHEKRLKRARNKRYYYKTRSKRNHQLVNNSMRRRESKMEMKEHNWFDLDFDQKFKFS